VQAAPVVLRALLLLAAALQLAVRTNKRHFLDSLQQVLTTTENGATGAETQCIVTQPVFPADTIFKNAYLFVSGFSAAS
jgi:hypothetical protein